MVGFGWIHKKGSYPRGQEPAISLRCALSSSIMFLNPFTVNCQTFHVKY